jgi:hypothetical protein
MLRRDELHAAVVSVAPNATLALPGWTALGEAATSILTVRVGVRGSQVFHGEVDARAPPRPGDMPQPGANEHQRGVAVREASDDASTSISGFDRRADLLLLLDDRTRAHARTPQRFVSGDTVSDRLGDTYFRAPPPL